MVETVITVEKVNVNEEIFERNNLYAHMYVNEDIGHLDLNHKNPVL
jgi:hypothetical protein